MVPKEEFIKLLEKFTTGTISDEDLDILFHYIRSAKFDDILSNHIIKDLNGAMKESAVLPAERSEEIIRKIQSSERQTMQVIAKRNNKSKILMYSAAAIFLVTISLGILLVPVKNDSYEFTQLNTGSQVEQVNTASKSRLVLLEDGSTIRLKPRSKITYSKKFLKSKREVYLEGEAFFIVTKNASHPFYVYTKNIITHVLGTSFNIKTDDEKRELEVAVTAGRVEVYEKQRRGEMSNDDNGVVLLPNYKVVYHENDHQFVPGLVDIPLPLAKSSIQESKNILVFEEEKLSNVLTSIEKSYGIEIEVENENINNCLFTGDISKQDLYTTLDILCQSISASYETKGTKILIRGKGCG